MVKGVSRRVVVVKTPDTRFFEQAIFLLKEDALSQKGVSPQRLLDEACRVADSYARSTRSQGSGGFWQGLLGSLAGGGCVGLIWLLTVIL